MNPIEMTLMLKIAHVRGCWEAIESIIYEMEEAYGEIPLSTVIVRNPDGTLSIDREESVTTPKPGETIWFPWDGTVAVD